MTRALLLFAVALPLYAAPQPVKIVILAVSFRDAPAPGGVAGACASTVRRLQTALPGVPVTCTVEPLHLDRPKPVRCEMKWIDLSGARGVIRVWYSANAGCGRSGYSLNAGTVYTSNAGIIPHEVGHSLGCEHSGSFGWTGTMPRRLVPRSEPGAVCLDYLNVAAQLRNGEATCKYADGSTAGWLEYGGNNLMGIGGDPLLEGGLPLASPHLTQLGFFVNPGAVKTGTYAIPAAATGALQVRRSTGETYWIDRSGTRVRVFITGSNYGGTGNLQLKKMPLDDPAGGVRLALTADGRLEVETKTAPIPTRSPTAWPTATTTPALQPSASPTRSSGPNATTPSAPAAASPTTTSNPSSPSRPTFTASPRPASTSIPSKTPTKRHGGGSGGCRGGGSAHLAALAVAGAVAWRRRRLP